MAHDPVWAVRWVKRAAKALAALCLLLAVLWIVWLFLPEGPTEVELRLTTNADANFAGRDLGRGEIVLDDSALRAGGLIVPAGTELSEIVAGLYPGAEFRGPIMVSPESMPREASGYECYLRRDGVWLIVRVWVFAIDDDNWLAAPIQFRDSKGRVHTACSRQESTFSWVLSRSFTKHREEAKRVDLLAADGTFPGEGETRIGPMEIR